ncbi:tail tape measure protein [uncultured Sphingorhabdus sp.]|uniref:tail tape measure protein n=1 Tax=uncultured Sphingorhabdus sp. TaxID=1686106 RepID=UPI002627DFF6|nr:tail tape measure protein [uncultured Sphingorhabdus sp.]
MDEEIERLVVSVRADTQGFARDVASMRAEMEGPFAAGIERTRRLLESSLTRAIQTGKFGFEDLRRIALSALAEIASAAIRSGMNSILGGAGGGQGQGGLFASLGSILVSALSGAPGRATGGPVAPGRAYRVGERGPELFVPTSAGRAGGAAGQIRGGGNVNPPGNASGKGRGSAPDAPQRSSRQKVRSLRRALSEVEA